MLQPNRVRIDRRRLGVGLGLQAGILERIVGRDDRQLDVAGHHLGGLAVALGDVVADLERGNFAGDLRGKPGGIERGDPPHADLAGQQIVPERFGPDADRGDDADAGDDDSSHGCQLSVVSCQLSVKPRCNWQLTTDHWQLLQIVTFAFSPIRLQQLGELLGEHELCSGNSRPAMFWSMWLNINSISATGSPPTVTVPLIDAPCSDSCSIFALKVIVSPGRTRR